MSKQPNVALPNMTAELSGRKKCCRKEKTRQNQETNRGSSLGEKKGGVHTLHDLPKRRLSDMSDELGHLGKSSDVEQNGVNSERYSHCRSC